MSKLDATDERLIHLLEQNARQSSEVIAKQLGISPATVRRRIRKLVDSDILRIAAAVDRNSIGYPLAAVIAFDVVHDKLESALKLLADRQEVKWVSTTTGRFDILALAWFRSTEELADFVQNKMAKIDGVRDSETFICLRRGKGRLVPV